MFTGRGAGAYSYPDALSAAWRVFSLDNIPRAVFLWLFICRIDDVRGAAGVAVAVLRDGLLSLPFVLVSVVRLLLIYSQFGRCACALGGL